MKKVHGSWFTVHGLGFMVLFSILCALCGLVYAEKAIINSVNRGEVTPEVTARTDLRLAYSAVRLMENFYCQSHGGAAKRPGTYYIAETADGGDAGRLVPFNHSSGRNDVLEFGDKTIRFYRGD